MIEAESVLGITVLAGIPKSAAGLLSCLSFFVVGLIIGWLIWRNLLREAVRMEEDNHRLHLTYQKRERAFVENRETATSMLGSKEYDEQN